MIPDFRCEVIRFPNTFLPYPSAPGPILSNRLEFGIKSPEGPEKQ